MCELKTIYGKAILTGGYYVITSGENKNKYLHRLIWEDYYNCSVPEGFVVHHRNRDKKCNCILNLELIPDGLHRCIHARDNIDFTQRKGDENNKYYRVMKQKDNHCRQGYIWRYRYVEDGKRKNIMSVDIKKLEAKVRAKGLDWYVLNDDDGLCSIIS